MDMHFQSAENFKITFGEIFNPGNLVKKTLIYEGLILLEISFGKKLEFGFLQEFVTKSFQGPSHQKRKKKSGPI